MMLIDLARELGTDVPTLAVLGKLGKTWSDATVLTPDDVERIRAAYAKAGK